jgi:hypothetical protein
MARDRRAQRALGACRIGVFILCVRQADRRREAVGPARECAPVRLGRRLVTLCLFEAEVKIF